MPCTLEAFLGPWLYWPLVAAVISFAIMAIQSNVSLMYAEAIAQVKEIYRATKGAKENGETDHS